MSELMLTLAKIIIIASNFNLRVPATRNSSRYVPRFFPPGWARLPPRLVNLTLAAFFLASSGSAPAQEPSLVFSTKVEHATVPIAVATDAEGNTFVTGVAENLRADAKVTRFGPQGARAVLVAKIDGKGNTLWTAVIGGETGIQEPRAIATDPAGNVHVAGTTSSSDFPTTSGVIHRDNPDAAELGFVIKLDSGGTKLVYSTFVADATSEVNAIYVDESGQATIAGSVVSMVNQPWLERRSFDRAGFVARLDASASSFVFYHRVAGPRSTSITALAPGPSGTISFAGQAFGPGLPLVNPIQSDFRSRALFRATGGAWEPLSKLSEVTALAWGADGKYLFAGGLNSLSRSADGGETWETYPVVEEHVAVQEFPSPITGIDFDPKNPARVFVAVEREGLFESSDSGLTWRRYGPLLPSFAVW